MRRSSMDLAAKGLTSRFSGKRSAGGKLQKQRRKSVAATALQHIRRASFSAQKESIFTDSSNDSSRLETTENSRTSYLSVLSQNEVLGTSRKSITTGQTMLSRCEGSPEEGWCSSGVRPQHRFWSPTLGARGEEVPGFHSPKGVIRFIFTSGPS